MTGISPSESHAQQIVNREYQIKAGFVGVLVDFVTWPGAQKPGINVPLTIGVVGEDPFAATMEDSRNINHLDLKVAEKNRQGKKLRVRRFASAAEVKDCHMVFVSPNAAANSNEQTPQQRLQAVLQQTAGQSVLVVGDAPRLAHQGATVNLVVNRQTNRVQIEVNPQAAKRASLSISPQLLNLATIVRESE